MPRNLLRSTPTLSAERADGADDAKRSILAEMAEGRKRLKEMQDAGGWAGVGVWAGRLVWRVGGQ